MQEKAIFYFTNNNFEVGYLDYGYNSIMNTNVLFRQQYSELYDEYNSLVYDSPYIYQNCGVNTLTTKYIKIIWFGGYQNYNNPDYLYAEINTVLDEVKIYFDEDSLEDRYDVSGEFSLELINYLLSADYDEFSPRSVETLEEYLIYPSSQEGIIISSEKIDRSYYFENLVSNFPLNTEGSCGYIALAILLSYYDILYSGDIVYENVYGNQMITPSNTTSTNLIYCNNSPGPSEHFHNMIRNDVGSLAGVYSSSFVSSNAININDIKTLLDCYMNYFSDYSMAGNTYTTAILNDINEVKNEIDLGRPVAIGISDYAYDSYYQIDDILYEAVKVRFNSGHVLIAYGYEIDSYGEIYLLCHSGWLVDTFFDVSNIRVKLLNDNIKGVTLRLGEYEHVCSNSYMINGVSFCPCINSINSVPNVINGVNYEFLALITQLENDVLKSIDRREENEN